MSDSGIEFEVTSSTSYHWLLTLTVLSMSFTPHQLQVIPDAYEQLPLNQYKNYGSMSMFHYSVPHQVSQVSFQFVATTNHAECQRLTAYMVLQQGSFPVISPDGSPFPRRVRVGEGEMIKVETQTQYSPNSTTLVHLRNPLPGDWFIAAYLMPDNKKGISVKGLQRDCQYALTTFATWTPPTSATIILPQQTVTTSLSDENKYKLYKIYVPEGVWHLDVTISSCVTSPHTTPTTSSSCWLYVSARAKALPFFSVSNVALYGGKEKEGERGKNCDGEPTCVVSISQPYTKEYLYILVFQDHQPASTTKSFNITVNMNVCGGSNDATEPTSSTVGLGMMEIEDDIVIPPPSAWSTLTYQQLASSARLGPTNTTSGEEEDVDDGVWEREYNDSNSRGLDADVSRDRTVQVIQNASSSSMRQLYDNIPTPPEKSGPCLSVIPMTRIKHMEDFSDTFVVEGTRSYTNEVQVSDRVPSLYSFTLLPYMDIGGSLQFAVNLNKPSNTTDMVMIKVELCVEQGRAPLYRNTSVICPSNHTLELHYNTSLTAGDDQELLSYLHFPYARAGLWFFTTTAKCFNSDGLLIFCKEKIYLTLDVRTQPCVGDDDGNQCGTHGYCKEAIQGQFLYAYCSCTGGWRGWVCDDGSQAPSLPLQLLGTLLLTLSNLMFIPAIALAVYRRYYPEALVYAGNMFFSTFYHACDRDEYAWCLMRYDVLQYMDFYLSILSFWVTLISMAQPPTPLLSLLHVGGCVSIALAVFYQRFGLNSFLIPAAIAAAILIIFWCRRCYRSKKIHPPCKWYLQHILPGLTLALVGLCLYAFVETESNYSYTHSVWHILVSSSILFLLRPRQVTPTPTSSTSSSTLHSLSSIKVDDGDRTALYPGEPFDNDNISNS